jgi:hypothetical protein
MRSIVAAGGDDAFVNGSIILIGSIIILLFATIFATRGEK